MPQAASQTWATAPAANPGSYPPSMGYPGYQQGLPAQPYPANQQVPMNQTVAQAPLYQGAPGAQEALPAAESEEKPKKKRNKRRIVGIVLLLAALALGLTAGYIFIDTQLKYSAQDAVNEELASHVEIYDDPSYAPTVDWAALKEIDPNVCAWVQIPGTVINYPVYQGEDNEYYLDYTAYGEYGVGGQIFLDCENTNPGMVDEQTVIFGHHLKNGTMFAPLADFDDQAVFDQYSTVWYVTESQAYELRPLLCYRTVGTDVNVRIYNWPTEQEFHDYLNGLLSRAQASMPEAKEAISGTQHVLTMSTCSYEEDNGRTILVSVPKNEIAAGLNPPAEPQAAPSEQAPEAETTDQVVGLPVGEVVGQPVGEVIANQATEAPTTEGDDAQTTAPDASAEPEALEAPEVEVIPNPTFGEEGLSNGLPTESPPAESPPT